MAWQVTNVMSTGSLLAQIIPWLSGAGLGLGWYTESIMSCPAQPTPITVKTGVYVWTINGAITRTAAWSDKPWA
jgi:hypothetical protein